MAWMAWMAWMALAFLSSRSKHLDLEAIKCGSKDNLSCMIVLLGGGEARAQ